MVQVIDKPTDTTKEKQIRFVDSLYLNPSELRDSLEGVKYPASKDELINLAKQNNAPNEVKLFLRLLPEGQYSNFQNIEFLAWLSAVA